MTKKLKEIEGYFHNIFAQIVDYCEIEDNGTFITMSHYPMMTWNKAHHNSINLYGHCHSMLYQKDVESIMSKPKINQYNVGVDITNFEPCTLSELKTINEQWIKKLWK